MSIEQGAEASIVPREMLERAARVTLRAIEAEEKARALLALGRGDRQSVRLLNEAIEARRGCAAVLAEILGG